MGGKLAALIALSVAILPAAVVAASPMEDQVLAALNFARSNPAAYIEMLKTYRGYFHAKLVTLPDVPDDIETEEGVGVVDETMAFLGRQAPLAPVAPAPLLERSSRALASDQGASGQTGHEGSDGSSPGERVRRLGGGDYIAEVIAYGPVDAVDAVRQLIVDDGVSDRGHRSVMFSPELRFAGVSCGAHKEFRTVCVIDLAVTADGRFAKPMTMARIDTHGPAAGK